MSPAQICETFGIAWQPQHLKLKKARWVTKVKMTTVAKDGKRREVCTIPLKDVPMWLDSINVSEVNPEHREK